MTWILLLISTGIFLYAIVLYNRLVRDKHRVAAGWSDVEVQLKRRHDLLPRLVDAVKQFASYEQATLGDIAALRSRAGQAHSAGDRSPAEADLSQSISRLLVLAEAYPELKADHAFLELQQQIAEVENDIQFSRRYYNGAVNQLNTRVESFPDRLIAGLFRFRQAEYFKFTEVWR